VKVKQDLKMRSESQERTISKNWEKEAKWLNLKWLALNLKPKITSSKPYTYNL
jgi:hypothetical protein